MTAVSSTLVNNASSADPGLVQGAASMLVLKKAIDAQSAGAMQLIAALPQAPQLAASGSLGTQVNTYA